MRKLLFRAHGPWDERTASEILVNNEIGGNTGNLLFLHSVMRTLMTEDTEIDTMSFLHRKHISQREVDYCNSEYDAFIIPLACAFRPSFTGELDVLADFVSRLKIPCVVAGAGIQARCSYKELSEDVNHSVRNFLNAVLDKSDCVGLRGEHTAQYLKYLGYKEEKDYTIIGCPSMYTFGDSLPEPRLTELTPGSKAAYNCKPTLKRRHYDFIRREAARFDNAMYISQIHREIRSLYVGMPYPVLSSYPPDFPVHLSAPEMQEGRMIGVLDKYSWIHYLEGCDFVFGSRIHGNIAGILAGTPCYIIAGDARVQELASYHNIPFAVYKDLKDDTTIFDLYEKADYGALRRGHEERVTHYLDFFERNAIPHLERKVLNGDESPYDRVMRSRVPMDIVRPLPTVSACEWERRIEEYDRAYKSRIKDARAMERDLRTIKGSRFWKLRNFCVRHFPGSQRVEI